MLQKLVVSPQSVVGSQPMPPERLAWVTNQVNLFFGSFRKADADDPEVFHSGCTRLFSAYAQEVVEYVVDPVTGLSTRSEWLPSLKKVKEALDDRAGWLANIRERDKREQEQIEARKREEKSRDQRPTYDELKAKHGHNWGFKAEEPRANETMKRANKIMFERECEAAGMPADSPISPSLASLIKAGMA